MKKIMLSMLSLLLIGATGVSAEEPAREAASRPTPRNSGGEAPPRHGPPRDAPAGGQEQPPREPGQRYSIEQATSDRAQLHTIAFSALAFLTGDFASDTFLPPGKVSDYFGFQYLRDSDVAEGGHNTAFLTRIAHNVLAILNDSQRAQLIALGKAQEADIRRFAEMRLPLIKAFRQNLQGELPVGSRGLERLAVKRYSADLYALDGQLAYQRAKVMATVLRSLSPAQKVALGRLKFGDSRSWPEVAEPVERRGLSHEVDVAVMTYASEMFSWYAGSLTADTYFCPERHAMYFGGFGMKTAPAMGKANYSISTALTGDSGEAMLGILNERQRQQISRLVEMQRSDLEEIVSLHRAIAGELRRFLAGELADQSKVLTWSRRYGELDGELSYFYATAFAAVGQSLSRQQQEKLLELRGRRNNQAKGPFLYATPVDKPNIANTDALFATRR